MARDLLSVLAAMQKSQEFAALTRNTETQFGTENRAYLGAELLPNVEQDQNSYVEESVRFRTVIANDGGRYNPVQLKATGVGTASFRVDLGYQDVGSQFTGRDYDAFLRLLNRDAEMRAMMQLIRWVDATVNLALEEKIEVARWQALVNCQVTRVGDGGYSEIIQYANPVGSRVATGGNWTSTSYDPWPDIVNRVLYLRRKGYTVNRIITSFQVMQVLLSNPNIATRANRAVIDANGQLRGMAGLLSIQDLNALAAANGMPNFETYDLSYNTTTGSGRFFPNDAMMFIASTGRDEELEWGDPVLLVPDTLGYTGIGTGVGQTEPGRVIYANPFLTTKPPRIECEGWQASLPVITEPDAIAMITGITLPDQS